MGTKAVLQNYCTALMGWLFLQDLPYVILALVFFSIPFSKAFMLQLRGKTPQKLESLEPTICTFTFFPMDPLI